MHIKNDHSLKVVTFRILAFLGDCVVALLKVACSPPKIIAVNKRNLLLGMRLQCTWSNEIASLQCSGHLIRKVYLFLILRSTYYSQNYATII